jgi:hypothetical protein
VIFVAANLPSLRRDAEARESLERALRARIERYYARHGIPSVEYDLQIL